MFTLRTKLSMAKALIVKKNSPFYIQYYINSRCNLMCKHCNVVESNSDVREAGLDDIEKIARNLVKVGSGVVVLMGGEPFLRSDYPDIIRIFVKHGLNVRLQTAGMKVATPEMLKACVRAGARDINVSLDSLDSSKQDYINSVPGSWNEAIKTVASISQIFPKNEALTSFGTVISRYNYPEIPSILKLATRIGWYLSLVPVHITRFEKPMPYQSYDTTFKVEDADHSELDTVFNRLIEMKKEGYKLFDSIPYLESSLSFMKYGKVTWRKNSVCDSPDLYFKIRPNGDFAVCADHKLKGRQVSLMDPDFPKIYRSREFRERVYVTTRACNGCQYGSYPEMTLSARSPGAVFERLRLLIKAKKDGIIPHTYDEIIKIINEIKKESPRIYGEARDINRYNNDLVMEWEDPKRRKELMKLYMARRKDEKRIRHNI